MLRCLVDLLIFVARKPAPWNLEAQEVVQLVPTAMGCNGFGFFWVFFCHGLGMQKEGVEFLTLNPRWWFHIFFIFTPILGEIIQFDSYFSDGLKKTPPGNPVDSCPSTHTLLRIGTVAIAFCGSSSRNGPHGVTSFNCHWSCLWLCCGHVATQCSTVYKMIFCRWWSMRVVWSFSLPEAFENCRFLTSDFCLAFRGYEKGRFKVSPALLQAKITVESGLLYWPFLQKNPPREALNERKDAGLPRVTRYDFLRMDLVPSNVEGTEATWEYLQLQKWVEAVTTKTKTKSCNPYLNPWWERKPTFFSCFPCWGQPFADEDTNRGLHAGALLPFSYKRGEGAFQVKSVKHNSCLSLS